MASTIIRQVVASHVASAAKLHSRAVGSTLCSMCFVAPRAASVVVTRRALSSWDKDDIFDDKYDNNQPRRSHGSGGGSGTGYNEISRRPGDWDCPACGAMVFSIRDNCYRCHAEKPPELRTTSRPDGGSFNTRPGDWKCPSCAFHNFASRDMCFKCTAPKPQGSGQGGDGVVDDFF